jgi:hypothetical protein
MKLISIAEADLTAGPSNRLLKNENKKVIVYTGIVVEISKRKGATKEELQKILNKKTKGIFFSIGKQRTYDVLVRGIVDIDFVARLERKNDTNTISNKTFDFSKTTVQQLIQNGYKETKEQLKEVLVMAGVQQLSE